MDMLTSGEEKEKGCRFKMSSQGQAMKVFPCDGVDRDRHYMLSR